MRIRSLLFPSTEGSFLKELAVALLGIIVGLSMALGHGLGKLPPSETMIQGLGSMGFPLPSFFAWCAALAEFGGGLCLALGLLTRGAALLMAITMAVALFGVHGADPFQQKELALLYFAVSLFFIGYGRGRWSLDFYLGRGAGYSQ